MKVFFCRVSSPPVLYLKGCVSGSQEGRPVMFTGEMVFPFFFEDIAGLRGSKDVAEAIAQWSDWGRLYDPDALAKNAIPCAATAYHGE